VTTSKVSGIYTTKIDRVEVGKAGDTDALSNVLLQNVRRLFIKTIAEDHEAGALAVLAQHNIDLAKEGRRHSSRKCFLSEPEDFANGIEHTAPTTDEERGIEALRLDGVITPRQFAPIVSDAAHLLYLARRVRDELLRMSSPPFMFEARRLEALLVTCYRLGEYADRLVVRPHEAAAVTGQKVKDNGREAGKKSGRTRGKITEEKRTKIKKHFDKLIGKGIGRRRAVELICEQTEIPRRTIQRYLSGK
jgi:hypothetical protein